LSYARTWGNPNAVEVVFSAPVSATTATNRANYVIAPGVTIARAALGSNANTVVLTTAAMPDGTLHTLTVNGVQDTATPPNTIPTNSQTAILKAQGVITRKFFNNVGGGNLSDLTNHVKFPNGYDWFDHATAFESLVNAGDNYGVQMHGLAHPPVTGDYSFYIAADERGVLFLSTNENAAGKVVIASAPNPTGSRQWNATTNQQSAYVRLEAGRAYYIEALMKEGGATTTSA